MQLSQILKHHYDLSMNDILGKLKDTIHADLLDWFAFDVVIFCNNFIHRDGPVFAMESDR